MNALLLVNGILTQPDIVKKRIQSVAFDRIIGVDGGSRHAPALGVSPDTIIGDMDSLADSDKNSRPGCRIITYPAQKNATDLELALIYAVEQGADFIVMACAAGGRLDMTLANVMLLAREHLKECRIEIWDGPWTAWLLRPPGELVNGNPGDTVSLIPLHGAASGITLAGFTYPLEDETLSPGESRGLSNVINLSPACISFNEGLLLAVHTPGNPENC